MKDEDKLQSLIDKYVELEKVIANKLKNYQKECNEINDPIKKQEFILEKVLPLKIMGLLQMDKANVVMSIRFNKFNQLEKELFFEINQDALDACKVANTAVKDEWKQIKEIINLQVKLLKSFRSL